MIGCLTRMYSLALMCQFTSHYDAVVVLYFKVKKASLLPDHNISSRALRAIITKWTHERSYWTSKSLWFGFSVSSIWFQVNLPVPLIESIYYVIEMSSFIWFCGIYVIGYVNILPTENIFVCILPIKQAHSMWLSFTDHKPKQNCSSSNSTYTDKYTLSWVTPEHWLYYFQ